MKARKEALDMIKKAAEKRMLGRKKPESFEEELEEQHSFPTIMIALGASPLKREEDDEDEESED